jgi:tRNA (adenine-N(1)-)-methyltransferase non-catalytic subunit
VQISKGRFAVKDIIGCPYGSVFQMDVKSRTLKHVQDLKPVFEGLDLSEEDQGETRDNRFIRSDAQAQLLSSEQIEQFKGGQLSTNEIVTTLVQNSVTFKEKSAYSQAKYVKRKLHKYSVYLRVSRPNATTLCELFFAQSPHKTAHMRVDALSQMLSMCNVRSTGNYLVIDCCVGLLTAAVLERLLGTSAGETTRPETGACIQMYVEPGPMSTWRQAVHALNYSPDNLNHSLTSIQYHRALELLKTDDPTRCGALEASERLQLLLQHCAANRVRIEANGDELETNGEKKELNDCLELLPKLPRPFTPLEDTIENPAKRLKIEQRLQRKQLRLNEQQLAEKVLFERKLDGILMIVRAYDPSLLMTTLLDFLIPSGRFVIFAHSIEPLVECYRELKGKAVNVKLSESWMRRYQVLSSRTRPDMNMSGRSGYFLSGIKA